MNKLNPPKLEDYGDLIHLSEPDWGAISTQLKNLAEPDPRSSVMLFDLMTEIEAQISRYMDAYDVATWGPVPTEDSAPTPAGPAPRDAALELALIHALMDHGLGTDSITIASQVMEKLK